MQTNTGKRTAKVRTTLTKRVIEALEPTDTSWIAWDDKPPGSEAESPPKPRHPNVPAVTY